MMAINKTNILPRAVSSEKVVVPSCAINSSYRSHPVAEAKLVLYRTGAGTNTSSRERGVLAR